MNFRMIPKSRAADSEIGFLIKSILKHSGHADIVRVKEYIS